MSDWYLKERFYKMEAALKQDIIRLRLKMMQGRIILIEN